MLPDALRDAGARAGALLKERGHTIAVAEGSCGGLVSAAAAPASISPTPAERPAAFGTGCAVSMRAPFTWSGVHSGCRASSSAAAPETIGAANEVPDIHMYPGATTRSGSAVGSVEPAGTGPAR